jgi:hypothetical protein
MCVVFYKFGFYVCCSKRQNMYCCVADSNRILTDEKCRLLEYP